MSEQGQAPDESLTPELEAFAVVLIDFMTGITLGAIEHAAEAHSQGVGPMTARAELFDMIDVHLADQPESIRGAMRRHAAAVLALLFEEAPADA